MGGLLYLSPEAPLQLWFTTLYAHKESRSRTYNDPGYYNDWCVDPELGEEIYYGGIHCDGTKFEPVDVIGNVYNRLILFDASCIHSASEYFGYNLKTGRLWHECSFLTLTKYIKEEYLDIDGHSNKWSDWTYYKT